MRKERQDGPMGDSSLVEINVAILYQLGGNKDKDEPQRDFNLRSVPKGLCPWPHLINL